MYALITLFDRCTGLGWQIERRSVDFLLACQQLLHMCVLFLCFAGYVEVGVYGPTSRNFVLVAVTKSSAI